MIEQLFEFAGNHLLLVTAFFVLLAALLVTESKRGAQPVSINEASQLINREQAAVLDLRSQAEFNGGHIHNALNIPYTSLASRLAELDKYKENPIILVCKMGQHSKAASKTLIQAGYTVKRLHGGMMEWSGSNLPLVKS